jgi:catechol 1,2-dioxygenase
MHRRTFIKDVGKTAMAVSVAGSIQWNDIRFVGDNPTTTDILGPFYRPGAPFRTNINPPGFSGEILHFSGTIYKEDGKTPFKNCLVEIWQCDEDQHYDNTSDDYRYRGAQKTDAAGRYSFITAQPVPYPLEEGSPIYRPAHIHMRISGEGQQDLITQIYFEGDSYIKDDIAASAPSATNRILRIRENNRHEKELRFDVVLSKELKPENEVYNKLAGVYKMSDQSTMEFYRKNDLLFLKWNGQIREALSYKGNNEFWGGVNHGTRARFELLPDQKVKVTVHYEASARKKVFELVGTKTFKY